MSPTREKPTTPSVGSRLETVLRARKKGVPAGEKPYCRNHCLGSHWTGTAMGITTRTPRVPGPVKGMKAQLDAVFSRGQVEAACAASGQRWTVAASEEAVTRQNELERPSPAKP